MAKGKRKYSGIPPHISLVNFPVFWGHAQNIGTSFMISKNNTVMNSTRKSSKCIYFLWGAPHGARDLDPMRISVDHFASTRASWSPGWSLDSDLAWLFSACVLCWASRETTLIRILDPDPADPFVVPVCLAPIDIFWRLRGYCTPGQFLDCFCIFLKNYNTLVTSKVFSL